MKNCGCKEKCFENGECWGHLEGVMCKNLGEEHRFEKQINICLLTGEEVNVYTTSVEYNKIKDFNDKK